MTLAESVLPEIERIICHVEAYKDVCRSFLLDIERSKEEVIRLEKCLEEHPDNRYFQADLTTEKKKQDILEEMVLTRRDVMRAELNE